MYNGMYNLHAERIQKLYIFAQDGSRFSISGDRKRQCRKTTMPNHNLVHPIHALDILLVDQLVQLRDDMFSVRVSLQIIDVRLHLAD